MPTVHIDATEVAKLAAKGMRFNQIAKALGVDPITIRILMRSKLFQTRVRALRRANKEKNK